MGRENSVQTVVHSSIALLQERFRQLQRVKEMREERELLRLFSSSSDSEGRSISPTSTACNVQPSNKLFYHPELIVPPQPALQAFHHFLRTESQGKHTDYLGNDQKGNTDFFAVEQKRSTDFSVDEKRNTDFFLADQKRNTNFLAVDTPLLMSLWPTDRSITHNSNTLDDSDVDTSLHL